MLMHPGLGTCDFENSRILNIHVVYEFTSEGNKVKLGFVFTALPKVFFRTGTGAVMCICAWS